MDEDGVPYLELFTCEDFEDSGMWDTDLCCADCHANDNLSVVESPETGEQAEVCCALHAKLTSTKH